MSADTKLGWGDGIASEFGPSITGYRILRRLGIGGQGEVWLATRDANGLRVAIKVLHLRHASDDGVRARFEQGFRTLTLLEHPAIVRPIDRGELPGGILWHATSYVPGLDVARYVKDLDDAGISRGLSELPTPSGGSGARSPAAGDPIPRARSAEYPLRVVLELFARICDAVEAAHRVGIIHRDLKPANILVDEDGLPHVLDFGLAKSSDSDGAAGAAMVTMTGQFIGSPAYASPEQVEARPGLIDARTDVYSLGVILYELLTGAFPYDVTGPLAYTFDQIRHVEPVPPRVLVRWVDADLQAIMLKALAKPRERRYQSVAELREDIERYQAGRPVHARGDGRAYLFWKFVRRNRTISAAAAVFVVLSVVYGTMVTGLYRRAEHSAADARAKFRVARETMDFVLAEVDERLRELPGATTARRAIMEDAYGRLEALLAEAGDDPSLQADMAQVHSRMLDIQVGLGNDVGVEAHAKAALAIWERLALTASDDPEVQAALSYAIIRVADMRKAVGDRGAALAGYERAMGIDERLAANRPDDLGRLERLGWSYHRVGCELNAIYRDRRGVPLLERRLEIAERLVESEPDNLSFLIGLCETNLIADENGFGRADMERHHRSAAQIAARLLEIDPDRVKHLSLVYLSHAQMARHYMGLDHLDEAADWLAEAESAIHRLRESEPHSPVARQWELEGVELRAALADARGACEEAEQLRHRVLAGFTDLVREYPKELMFRQRLTGCVRAMFDAAAREPGNMAVGTSGAAEMPALYGEACALLLELAPDELCSEVPELKPCQPRPR